MITLAELDSSQHFGLIQIEQHRILSVLFGRTAVMTLQPRFAPLMRPLRRVRQFAMPQ
jgi:hypothetical protein